MVENPFTSFKTTEIHISSELAGLPTAHTSEVSLPMGSKDRVASPNRGYDQYSVTIETSPMSPRLHQATPMTLPPTPGAQSMYHRHNNAALEANAAAWGYTRTASLFYVSLLITWLPSSINRVYGLAHPKEISFGFNYAAGLVLPLMGFWNAIIYITTSWSAVKALLTGKSPISLRGKHIGVRGRSMSLDTNAAGDGHMKKKRPTSTSVSDSTRGFADADSV
ncbi:hypothetical protein MMC06_006821 [Schaereria dolodes]|nr:hypothetical protein [Schaereria dolodes]